MSRLPLISERRAIKISAADVYEIQFWLSLLLLERAEGRKAAGLKVGGSRTLCLLAEVSGPSPSYSEMEPDSRECAAPVRLGFACGFGRRARPGRSQINEAQFQLHP